MINHTATSRNLVEPDEHVLVNNIHEEKHAWESCCLRVEKNMVVYLIQSLFSFCILAFCAFMLNEADGHCERSSPYLSLISFLCGKLLSSMLNTK